jgi:MurNAc alpha-1-phosphate uridylyltransferase
MQCIILAGGRGTRLGNRTKDVPKPLVEVADRPFLDYQLELLRAGGVTEVVLCVGYLGSLVEEKIGDGSRHGLDIRYIHDGPIALGTAGALRNALPLLHTRFLVTYGDTLLSVDYRAVADAHKVSSRPALMTVLENDDRFGSSNADVENGLVVAYGKSPPPEGARWVDYGLLAFDSDAIASTQAADLEDELARLARTRQLAAFPVEERFHEIGDEAALVETTEFVLRSPRFASLRRATPLERYCELDVTSSLPPRSSGTRPGLRYGFPL